MYYPLIIDKKWSQALLHLNTLNINPPELLLPLFKEICLDLAEDGKEEAARVLMRQTGPIDYLRKSDPDAYVDLEAQVKEYFKRPGS